MEKQVYGEKADGIYKLLYAEFRFEQSGLWITKGIPVVRIALDQSVNV